MSWNVVTTTSIVSTNEINHLVSLPAGIVAGNLLIVAFAADGGPSIDFPAGWTLLFMNDTPTQLTTLAVAYRQADGTEGASITVITGLSEQSAHNSYLISGADNPTVRPPQNSGASKFDNANPDSPILTPTGGAKDYLWLSCAGVDGGRAFTVAPLNYTNLLSADSGSPASGVSCGSARRILNASSENPEAFTIETGDEWVAVTIAIHPVALDWLRQDPYPLFKISPRQGETFAFIPIEIPVAPPSLVPVSVPLSEFNIDVKILPDRVVGY